MQSVTKPPLVFYQKLGELFYALAAADQLVHSEEYKALTEVVIQEWKDFEKDHISGNICQMEVIFNWFDYEKLDVKSCFQHFEDYKNENPDLFTSQRKMLIRKTANTIASSFSGKNKNELTMLAKLHLLLQE